MNFENELTQLINTNSPQVNNLRQKAINGNKQILQAFINVITKFLTSNNHKSAYQQINQLLISAKPQIAYELDNNILPMVSKIHCFQNLDEYIIFWKRIMNGTGTKSNYPNLYQRFRYVKLQSQNKKLSSTFSTYQQKFQKNLTEAMTQKVQFFQSFDEDSLTSQSINADNFAEIVQMDMQQIKQIRQQIQQGQIQQLNAEQYAIKVKNFLSLNPKFVKQERMQQFNNQRIWSRMYIENYKNWIKSGKLSLQRQNKEKQHKLGKTLALPIQTKPVQIMTDKSIKIWEEADEVNFQQTQVKKMNRVNKVSQNLVASLKQIQPQTSLINQRSTIPKLDQPQFILDTNEMNKIIQENQSQMRMSNSRSRPKIFGNTSRISQLSRIKQEEEQQPLENQLVVTKHTKQDFKFMNKKQNVNERPYSQNFGAQQRPAQVYRYTVNNQRKQGKSSNSPFEPNFILQQNKQPSQTKNMNLNQGMTTPIVKKNSFNNLISPNTGFKTAFSGTPYKKLSQLKEQKRQRKLGLINQQLSMIQGYLIAPYSQFFQDNVGFGRFKRNCLEDSFVLYNSTSLIVTCAISRQANSRANVQICYQNKSRSNLLLQTLYRIPKCLKIQKHSKISKKWNLIDRHIHNFSLQLLQFPLQPCALNLKYTFQQTNQNLNTKNSTTILLPFTIRNLMQSIVLDQQQFIDRWMRWTQNGYFRSFKNIILDPIVSNEDQLQNLLNQLIQDETIQGYSFKQFGACFMQSSFKNLTFLLRISQRVGTIVTLQLLANRRANSQDQIDYMEYCLNIWSILLSRIQITGQ